MRVDVAIAGGGPAGSACALSLRAHAPVLTVALIESSRYDAPRIGETLSPAARTILEHLGVFDLFLRSGHRETFGTAAAWGAASMRDNDFLLHARGSGWHLDRAAFDAMLAGEAARRGVTHIEGASVVEARRDGGEWCMSLSNGDTLAARFLVDATGIASLATRACGATFVAIDHLVSFARFFDDGGQGDPRTIVEAFPDGWWYTAALPDGRRVAACMTDADVARCMRLHEVDAWDRAAGAMPAIGAIIARASRPGAIIGRAAESRRLDPAAGHDWLAAGDSASRFDPLSSAGITKALRSGVFASYAIGDPAGLRRYQRFIRAEFDAYAEARTQHYAAETRWPEREFWRRRRYTVTGAGFAYPSTSSS